MRVFTKVVWEWRGDELVQTESESYEYSGPVDLLKGGGNAPENYKNLERLYGIQADQAEFLGQTFKGTVAPAYKKWLGEAEDYGSQANQELAAERAGKAASGATSEAQQSLTQDMASYGINPNDQRFQAQLGQMGIQGAAQQAAGETMARENIRDKGFARMQDAIGMGMGTPTQASQAANSAANAATSSLNAQTAAQQQQANSVGNIVRAGTNIWGAYNQDSGGGRYADGGPVGKRGILRLKQGGYVQRFAKGGFAGAGGMGGGFAGTPQIQAPPPMRPPPPPSGVEQAGTAATTPLGMQGVKYGIGKAAEVGGQAAGSPGVTAFGQGMQMSPGQARAAADAYNASAKQMAEQAVDKELGAGSTPGAADTSLASGQVGAAQNAAALEATQTGATTAADAESALAASQAAEAAAATDTAATAALAGGTEAAGAGLAGAAALGTAVPVLGAGLALYGIGNAAGWWADGGEITPGSHGAGGGTVDGPGGPKDDEVLAALSDGEFVMPVGAVKFFGIDRLEKMRQKGLEHEKSMGISR
jgi:hypothetical protein